ncbi:acyltransferase [Rudaea sp.]|uniref:acyltransferase family protein n=1 Tax=Rudaea sp. TaxID=2136325 RepID=UPI00321FFE46
MNDALEASGLRSGKIEFADALRGPATVFVLISHYLGNAWVVRPVVESMANVKLPADSVVATPLFVEMLGKIPAFDWGSYGVAIFFLVSGFVIPLSLQKYSAPAFLVGRVFRLWPVYAAGFSISILSMYAGGLYFGKPFQYTASQVFIHYFPGIRDLLWSANIDGIIWTLEIEIKFYLLCAFLAPLLRRASSTVFTAPLLIGATCLGSTGFIESHDPGSRAWQLAYALSLSGEFIVFMFLGTVFAYWRSGVLKTRHAISLGCVLFAIFSALVLRGPLRSLPINLGAYLAAILTFLSFAAFVRRTGRLTRFVSGISYPLYASHGAMGYLVIAVALQNQFSPAAAVLSALAVAIVVAAILHKTIELPTHRLGRYFARRITNGWSADPARAEAERPAPS